MGQFRVAIPSDAENLQALDIRFHYKQDIYAELSGPNAGSFRWVLYEKDNEIIAFHRTMLVSGWAFMGGVYIDKLISDDYLLYKLVDYAVKDLTSSNSLLGILAWTDSSSTAKAKLLEKLGFNLYLKNIHRFIFQGESLKRVIEIGQHIQTPFWQEALTEDYREIILLASAADSFVEFLTESSFHGMSRWYILKTESQIQAAINWWRHEDTLEVHFVLTRLVGLDVTDGIVLLAASAADCDLCLFKLNISANMIPTILRLLLLQPSTYRYGHKVALYRKFCQS